MGASVPAGARRYRVDAVVQAWGLTVFARQGVGEAWAELQGEETRRGRRVRFRFGGTSFPERTRGIWQMGYFEEDLEEAAGQLVSSRFFGFLTASPEAKRVVRGEGRQEGSAQGCAVEGSLDEARFQYRKTYEAKLDRESRLGDWTRVSRALRGALEGVCPQACVGANGRAEAKRSFLKAILESLEAPGEGAEVQYHYGDRVLQMRSKKSAAGGGLHCLEAQVQGRGRHRFAFYFRPTAPFALPERVEYWPRLPLAAALRLTLVPISDSDPQERS